MIRDAKFSDIPGIADLLKEQFRKSHYCRDGTVGVDEMETKRLLVAAIQRHGGRQGGSTFVQVAENNGIICGVIVGTLQRVYSIGDKLMATDLFWTANGMVDPRDPERLMRNMIDWARKSPNVAEVKVGATKVIEAEPERVGRLLGKVGMQNYGTIFRMEVRP